MRLYREESAWTPQPRRRELKVEVEVLDVTEDEARTLLLSIDPLAALAQTQEQLHDRLLELTPAVSPELREAWDAAANAALAAPATTERPHYASIPEQFLILLTCRDEHHQAELLRRFHAEGLECKALLS